jgi:hypothetical protein
MVFTTSLLVTFLHWDTFIPQAVPDVTFFHEHTKYYTIKPENYSVYDDGQF